MVGDVIRFIYSNGKWKQPARISVRNRAVTVAAGHFRASFPAATLKMIDNLFNSFTCHAVPGLL